MLLFKLTENKVLVHVVHDNKSNPSNSVLTLWQNIRHLTWNIVCMSHWFSTNPVTSIRAKIRSWTGLVFPWTAPIATRVEAAHSSASIKLKK